MYCTFCNDEVLILSIITNCRTVHRPAGPSSDAGETMPRLTIPAREAVPADSQPLLDAVEKLLGVVPNLFRLVGNSPAALEGLLGLNGALSRTLDPATRERIAIAVAQVNGCDY